MAIQHVGIKNGARGTGGKHALYVAGEGKYADKEHEVIHLEDGNLPKWAGNAVEFFKAADELERGDYTKKVKTKDGIQYEKHVRGRSYKEVEIGIPREAKDPVKWAKDYARELLGELHPYRMAVHDKPAGGGGRNVHMHLMFSTRTMDGHDRDKETFFKRAASAYRHPKTKELVQRDPASGGAVKSKYWNSMESVHKTRAIFEMHVQRVAPGFKLERSDAPEPKIGPVLEKAGKQYAAEREERAGEVAYLRSLKMARSVVDKEIEREELMVGAQARRPSATDELWAKMAPKKEPQREAVPVKPDWSQFANMAGSRGTADDERKGKAMTMEPQNGPQYFPQSKEEKERNRDEAGALHRIEQQRKDQREQEQPTKSRSDDLWERMERDRQQKAQEQERGREQDSGRDFDM